VGKLDVQSNMQTAMRYQIRRMPTLLLFKNGDVIAQSVGVVGETEIQEMLDPHI